MLLSVFPATCARSTKIFYRVVADIAPGEELLLFMKSEEDPHEPMAPDIHGECGVQHPGEPMAPGIHGERCAQLPGPAAFWRQQCFQEGPSHLCFLH